MFVDAIAKATQYTRPLITTTVSMDGTIDSGVASYMMINRDGWAITAAHCINCVIRQKLDADKRAEIDKENATGDHKEYDPKGLKAHWIWWGHPAIRPENIHILGDLDLAIVKLVGIPANFIGDVPVFKKPADIKPGLSLCRVGFPFISIKSEFEQETGKFTISGLPDFSQMFFPNDGMLTRSMVIRPNNRNPDAKEEILPLFFETSTPGFKGQSGGPIFDRNGNVVGLQSQTDSKNLGFGDRQIDGKYMPEQFLNLGIGIHAVTIMKALDKFGVKYKSESDDDGYRIIG